VPDAVDGEHVIFVGRAAEHLGDVIGTDGIARSEWVRLEAVPAMIAAGEIWASATLIGLLHVMAQQRQPGDSGQRSRSALGRRQLVCLIA